ncbi:MAG: hypothetical protein KGN00_07960 [Chloroflexota bacterium]|nr:hypothetical protein [Chloroflexota bacterium]MDE3193604.1 hypothetical protein [Chloroflexota bacterium]
MANPVTWFEIMGKDSERLQRFYREVFGWKMSPPVREMGNYSMLGMEEAKPGIGGGIGEGDPRVSVYVEVRDIAGALKKAVASGATQVMGVTTVTPTTTIAMLTDPAGNVFGLLKAQPAPRTATRATATKTARPPKRAASRTKRTSKPAKRTSRARRTR